MEKYKVLFIQQEITPYVDSSHMGIIGRYLPQAIQDRGKEIRTFMPRYGCINERRNQLHEVIRLSGMNLIINDTDHSLIIKVASIQPARMQVYFIDNVDYFQRKYMFYDNDNKFFKDNEERAIFFCRGVIETINKLSWVPDLVHCHGWITNLIPIYLKKAFVDNPLFADTKIIYSVYNDEFTGSFSEKFANKLKLPGISNKDMKHYHKPTFVNITKAAIDFSDGVIYGSEEINSDIKKYITQTNKPTLKYQNIETYINAYSDFYDDIMVNELICSD